MQLSQKAAILIKILMRELRVSDKIVFPEGESPFNANNIIECLEEDPKVGDRTGDAAIAIGEHAFRAGWNAGRENVQDGIAGRKKNHLNVDSAWSEYDPPEHIKALS